MTTIRERVSRWLTAVIFNAAWSGFGFGPRVPRWDRPRKLTPEEARREHVREVFSEIGRNFALKGLEFRFTFEHGKYEGETLPTASGGYIAISEYYGDLMIDLNQADLGDATASFDQRARSWIHQHIVMPLIYNAGSPDRRFFFRQDIAVLEQAGIEAVTASLCRMLAQYDEIWSVAEKHGTRRRLVEAQADFNQRQVRALRIVDVAVEESVRISK